MNRFTKFLGNVCLALLFCGVTVFATSNVVVMESYTGDSSVTVYVKGTEAEVTDLSVQIGTTVAESAFAQAIETQDVPMQTLIMLDNSLSISKADRAKIASFMQDMISDRMTGEQIAVATFSETITYLTEYTDDYTTLKSAVEGIEYQDQETYLTDVLYELLSTEYIAKQEDIYRRIIVVSDGVDNKSLGYTKEELLDLLEDHNYPIYTIGCATGKNNEQLENMFALSRKTSADSFLISDVENTMDINTALNQDRSNVKLVIKPAAVDMDGSTKAVKISFQAGTEAVNLSVDIKMPQKQIEVVEETTVEEVVEESTVEEAIPQEAEFELPIPIIIAVGVVLVIVIVGIILLVVFLSKRNRVEFESIDENVLRDLEQNIPDDSRTEYLPSFHETPDDDDRTCMIWNESESYHVVLTDVDSPMKTFQIPLNQSIIIGRKQGMCGIVIDYDKSVSGRHCQISVRNGKFYIVDLQSSNGTYVNDNKVLSEVEICSGNIIKLGRLRLKFEVR